MGKISKVIGLVFVLVLMVCFFSPVAALGGACPSVPAGAFSPGQVDGDKWEVWRVDLGNGFILFLGINHDPAGLVRAAMGLTPEGAEWPLLFNYVLRGEVVFLRYEAKLGSYVWDDSVDEDSYNTVVKMYRVMLKVDVNPRRSV